ncbi:sulfite exporter TauE/SafE family protein [Pikeienuella piscinae]|uniref:Probable membrane transporter protein n=1 Tax=Pikeienuella piscinae TaxID=2748098 RepID=A0A7M3T6J7_9RHOB|nr:sulfite exporter TauE/SafE family protein [Pikeienuella piscinae]QIE57628.1 sulfite exporter TauE/SafE family protein [Pikeienuella piscinae]
MLTILALTAAGFAGGALNAVAGGGTFVTFPLLIWAGAPPVIANATATMTAVPGYCASAWAFRREIRAEGALGVRAIIALTALGGLLGAGLLIFTPASSFVALVPWLLLAATLLFIGAPRLLSLLRARGVGQAGPLVSAVTLLAVAGYGGYFNGGLGIMLLALFSMLGFRDLNGMNGLKNLLSVVLSVTAVATFVVADVIAWDAALPMSIGNACGAYFASDLARRLDRPRALRIGIALVGLAMTAIFFLR